VRVDPGYYYAVLCPPRRALVVDFVSIRAAHPLPADVVYKP